MKKKLPEQLRFLESARTKQKTCSESMLGKLSIVTGSTSGVGLEAVKRLALAGSNIVMVCRNGTKAETIRKEVLATSPVIIDIITADFSDLAQVRNAANVILGRYRRIDVLIQSAGLYSTTRKLTADGFELVFGVNHLASFLFTSLLLDRMKESAPARIILVNSEGYRFGGLDYEDLDWSRRFYTGLRSYGASKTAQLLAMNVFASNLANTGLTINAIHPGTVRTNIGGNNGLLYRLFFHGIVWRFMKDPVIAGEALYWMAASAEVGTHNGAYFNLTTLEEVLERIKDKENSEKMWNLSRKLTGLDA
jgi:NAD(P)-dependent dehydrogenase (short-subunit alcohol dehydrogenase family)